MGSRALSLDVIPSSSFTFSSHDAFVFAYVHVCSFCCSHAAAAAAYLHTVLQQVFFFFLSLFLLVARPAVWDIPGFRNQLHGTLSFNPRFPEHCSTHAFMQRGNGTQLCLKVQDGAIHQMVAFALKST